MRLTFRQGKFTRLSCEYLTKNGFFAFREEPEKVSYTKKLEGTYIGIVHYGTQTAYNAVTECYTDSWELMIKTNGLLLKYECNTVERLEETLKFFNIKL